MAHDFFLAKTGRMLVSAASSEANSLPSHLCPLTHDKRNQVQYFFQKNGQVCTDKEVQFFIQRFDLDQDNLISFSEFVQEFSPKTTQ